jgi:hypothetical protein
VTQTHLYWGYKLSRAEELFEDTGVCTSVCNLTCERQEFLEFHSRACRLELNQACVTIQSCETEAESEVFRHRPPGAVERARSL